MKATAGKSREKEPPHRATLRLLGLFHALAKANEGLTLAALSAMLEVPKSSLLLLLRPLVSTGYLVHESGAYRLGTAIFRLSAEILSTRSFPKLVRPYMEKLAVDSQETVFLGVMDREQLRVVYVETIESPQLVRYTVPVGSSRPLYCSAAGRLLLAYQNPEWRDKYLRTTVLKPVTSRAAISKQWLKGELEKIRRAGTAVSIGSAVPWAAGVAAPILDSNGSIAAALLVGAPSDRFQKELPLLRRLVKEAAAQVSGALAVPGKA